MVRLFAERLVELISNTQSFNVISIRNGVALACLHFDRKAFSSFWIERNELDVGNRPVLLILESQRESGFQKCGSGIGFEQRAREVVGASAFEAIDITLYDRIPLLPRVM